MGHDLLIYLVVGFILVLQVGVFLNNLYKIRSYKNSILQSSDFEIIEVMVDEDEIEDIDVALLVNGSYTQDNSQVDEELSDQQGSVRLPEIGMEDLDKLNDFEDSEDYSSQPKKKAVNDDYDELPF